VSDAGLDAGSPGGPLSPDDATPLLIAAAEGTAQSDYFVLFDADCDLIASSEPMRRFRAQTDSVVAHRGGARRHIGQVVLSRGSGETNRTLRALDADGLVKRDKRRLLIPSWRRLAEVADFNERYLHLKSEPVSRLPTD
jgi:hypothetical protein